MGYALDGWFLAFCKTKWPMTKLGLWPDHIQGMHLTTWAKWPNGFCARGNRNIRGSWRRENGMTSVWGRVSRRERDRQKTVLSTTLSTVNLNFKLLFWLVYKMSYTSSSQCPATFPQAMLCYRAPNFKNHLPYVWTKYQGHWDWVSRSQPILWLLPLEKTSEYHIPLARRLVPNLYWDIQLPPHLAEQSPHTWPPDHQEVPN